MVEFCYHITVLKQGLYLKKKSKNRVGLQPFYKITHWKKRQNTYLELVFLAVCLKFSLKLITNC